MGDRAVWLTVDGPTRREGCEPPRPQTYFCLALYTFALVGLVLLAVEPVLGLPADSLFAQVVHWVLTITVWLGGAIGLTAWAGHRTDFRVRGDAEPRMGIVRCFAVAALVVVTLAAQWMLQRGVLSPFAEHNALSERFGDAGTVAWLVQVAYYCARIGRYCLDRWVWAESGRMLVPTDVGSVGRDHVGDDLGSCSLPHSGRRSWSTASPCLSSWEPFMF